MSGGGLAGIQELEAQVHAAGARSAALSRKGGAVDLGPTKKKWTMGIAFNVSPLNYVYVDDGY